MGIVKTEKTYKGGNWCFLRSNREFLKLWCGGSVSLLGDSLNNVAVVLLTATINQGSAFAVGVVIGLRFIPRMLCSIVAGVLADRHDRKSLLFTLDLIMALLAVPYIFVTDSAQSWLLYPLVGLMGATNALFLTVRLSLVPDLVGKENMGAATALNQISIGGSTILGNVLGGAIVGFVGYRIAFVINIATFLISALCTLSIKRSEPTVNKSKNILFAYISHPIRSKFREFLIDGANYLKQHYFILRMIFLNVSWSLGGGGVFVIMAMLNYKQFENSETTLGVFYSMAGVGAVLAAFMKSWFGKNPRRDTLVLGLACIVEGIALIVLTLVSGFCGVVILFGFQMTATFVFGLVYEPLLITCVSDEMRGRVVGFSNGLMLPVYGLSAVIHGLMLNHMSLSAVSCVSGGIMALSGLAWLYAMAGRADAGWWMISPDTKAG